MCDDHSYSVHVSVKKNCFLSCRHIRRDISEFILFHLGKPGNIFLYNIRNLVFLAGSSVGFGKLENHFFQIFHF